MMVENIVETSVLKLASQWNFLYKQSICIRVRISVKYISNIMTGKILHSDNKRATVTTMKEALLGHTHTHAYNLVCSKTWLFNVLLTLATGLLIEIIFICLIKWGVALCECWRSAATEKKRSVKEENFMSVGETFIYYTYYKDKPEQSRE